MKTVIMAGGRGTRISSIASDIPKPMIEIEEKPVLEHEIMCLREQGFTDIIITVSHLGQIVMDYFGGGSQYGVSIEYYLEEEPLGNAGALFRIKDKLTDSFMLLNGDVLFDVDFRKYVILGACNPGFAFKALTAEDKVGTMLPCNVILQELEDGKIDVAAVNPKASMQAIENRDLEGIANEVSEKLKRVIEAL